VLRDNGDKLQAWLEHVPYSREIYNEWADAYYDGYRPDDDIERAGRFFYLRYTSFAGKIESKTGFASGCGNTGTIQSRQFKRKIDALTDFRNRLRAVEIECDGAIDVIDRHDSNKACFYADPPYQGTEGRYNSEGFNHRKLAEKAKEIDGKMVISYDSIPPFYGDGFTVVSKQSHFSGGNTGGQNSCTEHLIMNYDSDGEPLMSDVGQQTLSDCC
jgi:DNA adenine methylase